MGEGKINYIGQRNNGFMKGELLIMIYKYFTEEELNTLSNVMQSYLVLLIKNSINLHY